MGRLPNPGLWGDSSHSHTNPLAHSHNSLPRLYAPWDIACAEWGGKKDEDEKTPMAQLPFFCCSLSLSPFKNPVCTEEGIVFDIL